jgi:hypothetical protein
MAAAPRKRASREIWHPVAYNLKDIRAVQAVAAGSASAAEQKRALDWIVNKAAQTYDEPFVANQDDVRCYVLGRRSVGLAIVKLLRLKPDAFRAEREVDE